MVNVVPGWVRRIRGIAAMASCTPFSYSSLPRYSSRAGPFRGLRSANGHSAASIPLRMTRVSARPGPNSSVISSLIDLEHVMSESDSCTSHDSTAWTWRLIRPATQPECLPASVAWMVETSGTSKCSARAIAGWATSQSCACTTSGRHVLPARRSRVFSARPVRTIACPIASVHAIMSVPKSNSCGSCAAATTRTPSLTSSDDGWVLGSVPAGRLLSTTTSWPASASAVARWWTWRPSPPITTGGYSHDTIRIFIACSQSRASVRKVRS
jgi:hypothetical protein